jgi:hypothetical protein
MSDVRLYNCRQIYKKAGVADKVLSVPFTKAAEYMEKLLVSPTRRNSFVLVSASRVDFVQLLKREVSEHHARIAN